MRTKSLTAIIAFLLGLATFAARSGGDIRRPFREPVKAETITPELSRTLWEKGQVLEQKGEYPAARRVYEELLKDCPASPWAAEAQFHRAVCLEKEDDLYEAFLAYQKLLDDYPGHGDLIGVVERQFRIGEDFLNGRKRLILFLPIRSGLGTAAEIFRAVVKNATFSPVAPRAQYDLGYTLQQQGEYEEAELEYDLVLKNYPGTEVVGPTLFQMGVCAYEQAHRAAYDQEEVNKGVKLLKSFLRDYSADPHAPEAQQLLDELLNRGAKKAFEIAEYYEGNNSPEGARIYYQEVAKSYPGTSWAERALKKLDELGPSTDQTEP